MVGHAGAGGGDEAGSARRIGGHFGEGAAGGHDGFGQVAFHGRADGEGGGEQQDKGQQRREDRTDRARPAARRRFGDPEGEQREDGRGEGGEIKRVQIGGVGKEEREAGPKAAPRRAVADGAVEAVEQQGRERHGEAGGRAGEERDPAVGERDGDQGRQQGRRGRRCEPARKQAEEPHAQQQRGEACRVPAGGMARAGGEGRVDQGKRHVIEIGLDARGVVAEIEFVDVVEEGRMARERVEAEPEMIEQLEVVARNDGPDGLRSRIEIGVGDGVGKDPRQRPGREDPEQQSRRQQQAGIAKARGRRPRVHGTHGRTGRGLEASKTPWRGRGGRNRGLIRLAGFG